MAANHASDEAMAAMKAEMQRRFEKHQKEMAAQNASRKRQDDLEATDWVSVRCGYG